MDSSTSGWSSRLRGFLEQDPSNATLACELFDSLNAEGRPDEAVRVFEGLPETVHGDAGVRFRTARVALMEGRYADAESSFRALRADGHDGMAIGHDLAFAQLCQKHAVDALGTLDDTVSRFGDAMPLSLLKARCALMLENYEAALQNAVHAVEQAPESADAWGVLALVRLDSTDSDGAAQAAQNALARDPQQHEALMVAGTLALWGQRADEASELFELALQRHPNSGRVLSGLGQALMLRNELDLAREVLERAVVAMPDHIGTWHALAWAQLLRGETSAAEASYTNAYALDRNFGDTHGGLALIAALRGEHDEAEQHAKRALRLDPNAMTARYAQTLVLQARGQDSEAEQAMATLLDAAGNPAGLAPRDFAQRLKQTLQPGNR